ncbi:hypothetical protein ACN27G_34110 [Plantactinospora sp. WMMB334]|uniref:hypothetical protein n=1 Tax=Plantactinospora sp. WMMB334 TaxID=3404119 RepID=UPI003B950184
MSTDVPVPPPPGQPAPPPANPRWRRWLLGALAGWAALLLVLTLVSVRRDDPTVREQRSIEQAGPVVDRALGELVAAAGPDVAVELAPRVPDECELTVLREGATLDATVLIRAPEAELPGLLDRIAQRLPAAYRAGVRHSADGSVHVLRADAGEFVAIEGGQAGPGILELTVSTGCRPVSGGPDRRAAAPLPPAEPDPLRVLGALGATEPTPVELVTVGCPGRGRAWTAYAIGRGSSAGPPGALLPRPAGAVVIADTTELYAYRSGPVSVVVESGDGRVRVATTTSCEG